MSVNGRVRGDMRCVNCEAFFTRRFPAERYCSNACAATGTPTLPAAEPVPPLRIVPEPVRPLPAPFRRMREWLATPSVARAEAKRLAE